jgi:predicted transcriptional regulator
VVETTKPKANGVTRVSVSLPVEHHEAMSRLADQKKVSLAWVIRDAVEKYLAADTPLFDARQGE